MSLSHLKKYWPMFDHFDKEFMAKIKLVMVYGIYAHKALMVLKDDSVYEVGTDVVRVSDTVKSINSLWKPTKVDELSNKEVRDFAWGRKYGVAALTDKGEVYYWKQKESEDQCSIKEARPTLLGGSLGRELIVQISCSDSYLLALTDDGNKVFRHDGDNKAHNILQNLCTISPLLHCAQIACSPDDVRIVDTRGKLHVFRLQARTYHSACGSSHYVHELTSSLLKIVIVKVACGCSHTLALSENGDVYVWGENSYGQLGIGTTNTSTAAVKVNSTIMGKVADIAAIPSDFISAVLTCTGQVFVWGRCRGLKVFNPTLTPFSTFHEVFGAYAHPNVIHSPLILRDEEKEEENEKGKTDVIDSYRQAFDNPSNSDFVIKVEGKPIHVHKSVLGIRSIYFQSMFKEQWAENNQSTLEHNDFPYDVYKSFLKYLYTGEIDVQDEKLMELLALANAYCELQLKRRCEQILGKDIEVSNVLRLYEIAATHESTELEDLCVEFALNHMSVIVRSPQFATLSGERVRTFMIKAAAKGLFHWEQKDQKIKKEYDYPIHIATTLMNVQQKRYAERMDVWNVMLKHTIFITPCD